MLPVLETAQQTALSLKQLESENCQLKATIEQHQATAKRHEQAAMELNDRLAETESRMASAIQSKVSEKECELEVKFDGRLCQLQSLQQVLVEKLSASEQRAATLQFALSSALVELSQYRSQLGADSRSRSLLGQQCMKPCDATVNSTEASPVNAAGLVQLADVAIDSQENTALDCRVDSASTSYGDAASEAPKSDDGTAAVRPLEAGSRLSSVDGHVSQEFGVTSPTDDVQVLPLCLSSRAGQTGLTQPKTESEHSQSTDDTDNSVLNTTDVAQFVRHVLLARNIGQRQFARGVLGLSQGTVSELLAKPKPWDRLSEKGRDSYRRMYQWAVEQTGTSGLWMDSSQTDSSTNAVSSSISNIGGYRHDNSAATEQRVAQILSEARAAMKTMEVPQTKASAGALESVDVINSTTVKPVSDSQSDGVGDTTLPAVTGDNLSDCSGRTIRPASVTVTKPLPKAAPGETDPRDIVARIYREELQKLATAAKTNGNFAEYIMYERELERLAQSTTVASEPVPAVSSPAAPRRRKDSRQSSASKRSLPADRNAALPTVLWSSVETSTVDHPEDLRIRSSHSQTHAENRDTRSADFVPSCSVHSTPDLTNSLLSTNHILPVVVTQQELIDGAAVVKSETLTDVDDDLKQAAAISDGECSPLDLMRTIADSITSKSHKKSATLETSRYALPPITAEQLKRCSNLNTDEVVAAVRSTLADYSISQRLFGEAVLGLSQGSVSDLLARPKPWPLLTSKGREPFIRMRIFLDDPEGTVRRLVTTQYRVPADKLLRCGDQSDTEVATTATGRKRKGSMDSSASDGAASQRKKQPRVSFTAEQKDALRRAYEADPYPTQPSIDRLASDLGIGPRTVINWFHNHRMRYAKQQYAATGIWSVTGPAAVTPKTEPADLDPSNQSFCEDGWESSSASTADLLVSKTPSTPMSDLHLTSITGTEDISASIGSPGVGSGANRRKSARPQRLGTSSEEDSAVQHSLASSDCHVADKEELHNNVEQVPALVAN